MDGAKLRTFCGAVARATRIGVNHAAAGKVSTKNFDEPKFPVNMKSSHIRDRIPESFAFRQGSAEQREYVENVYKTILEKDVLKRNRAGGRLLVGQIIRYMANSISSLTSPKRMADRLRADGATACVNTISSYLEILEDCFFLYKADRFDIKGGEMLKLINKYYLTDFGFKYHLPSTVY